MAPALSGSPWMIVGESATEHWASLRQAGAADALLVGLQPLGATGGEHCGLQGLLRPAASSAGHPWPSGDDLSHAPRSATSTGKPASGARERLTAQHLTVQMPCSGAESDPRLTYDYPRSLGKSTSEAAFNDLRRQIAQRNEQASQEARRHRAVREQEQMLRHRARDF